MSEHIEKAYTTKEVSTTLGIGDSTLRKWCIALEDNGYQFIKSENKRRLYTESDLVVLRHFQQLVQDHNMPLDNASNVIVSRFGNRAFEGRTGIVPAENRSLMRSDEVIEKLFAHIEQQEKFNMELIERLDQQQRYIEEKLNNRDQQLLSHIRATQKKLDAPDELKNEFEQMKATMNELLENQKQMASTLETKKGFWSKFFGK